MGKKKFRKSNKAVFNAFSRKAFPPRVSIMVGMPTHHGINQFTQCCLDKAVEYFGQRGIPFGRWGTYGNSHIDAARNRVVEHFLEQTNHTHMLWVDDDMAFDPEAIEVLLRHDVPVASGVVTRKHPPYAPAMYTIVLDDKKQLTTGQIPFGTYPLDKEFYFPLSGIGAAFMLVKREVLEKMERPWFASPPTTRGTVRGEDYYFCFKLGAMGLKILYDPTIPIYHMGECPFGIEDHAAFMALEQEEPNQCRYTNINAASVAQFKKSFAGPNRSLIASLAPAAAKRHAELVSQGESKSVQPECQSSEKCDPTTPPTKTGIEVPK
jgi:hypothetical protein